MMVQRQQRLNGSEGRGFESRPRQEFFSAKSPLNMSTFSIFVVCKTIELYPLTCNQCTIKKDTRVLQTLKKEDLVFKA